MVFNVDTQQALRESVETLDYDRIDALTFWGNFQPKTRRNRLKTDKQFTLDLLEI